MESESVYRKFLYDQKAFKGIGENMKLRGKKIAALFLACALCSGSVMPVSATSISETQKKGEQLEEQKKAAEARKAHLTMN